MSLAQLFLDPYLLRDITAKNDHLPDGQPVNIIFSPTVHSIAVKDGFRDFFRHARCPYPPDHRQQDIFTKHGKNFPHRSPDKLIFSFAVNFPGGAVEINAYKVLALRAIGLIHGNTVAHPVKQFTKSVFAGGKSLLHLQPFFNLAPQLHVFNRQLGRFLGNLLVNQLVSLPCLQRPPGSDDPGQAEEKNYDQSGAQGEHRHGIVNLLRPQWAFKLQGVSLTMELDEIIPGK